MLACSSDKGTVHIFKLRKEIHDVEHGAVPGAPEAPRPAAEAGVGAGAGAGAGAGVDPGARREDGVVGGGSAGAATGGGGIAPTPESEEGSNKSRHVHPCLHPCVPPPPGLLWAPMQSLVTWRSVSPLDAA